jgi:hypothetical protein
MVRYENQVGARFKKLGQHLAALPQRVGVPTFPLLMGDDIEDVERRVSAALLTAS